MQRGDLVELPDGRAAYYQHTEPDTQYAVVVLYERVPVRDLKRVKDQK